MKNGKLRFILQFIYTVSLINIFLYYVGGSYIFKDITDYVINFFGIIIVAIIVIAFLLWFAYYSENSNWFLKDAIVKLICLFCIILFPFYREIFTELITYNKNQPDIELINKRVGKNGEEMLYNYLEQTHPDWELLPMSKTLARNLGGGGNDRLGYDLEITSPDGHTYRIEIKSTKSELPLTEFNFTNNEVKAMRQAEQNPKLSYRIYRLYNVSSEVGLDTKDFNNLHYFVYDEDQIELMLKYGYEKDWGYHVGEDLVPNLVRQRYGFPHESKR